MLPGVSNKHRAGSRNGNTIVTKMVHDTLYLMLLVRTVHALAGRVHRAFPTHLKEHLKGPLKSL
jgi:hypothetical protein